MLYLFLFCFALCYIFEFYELLYYNKKRCVHEYAGEGTIDSYGSDIAADSAGSGGFQRDGRQGFKQPGPDTPGGGGEY